MPKVRCTASGQERTWTPEEWASGAGSCPDCGADVEVWVRGTDLCPRAKARAHTAPPGVDPAPYRVRDDVVDLYHRTTPDRAARIMAERRMTSLENTAEVYFSTMRDGQAVGYGDGVVHVQVPRVHLQLEDEFPDGEQHYRIKARDLLPSYFVADSAGSR